MPPKQRCRRLLGALAMACACTLASAGARAATERGVIEREARVAAADGGPPVYVKEILGPVLTLDRIYPSMKGPFATHGFSFEGSDEGELLWMTGYDAVMVAADGSTPMSQQFMCHSNLDFTPREHFENFRTWHSPSGSRAFSLAQGQLSIQLPEGFGVPVMSDEKVKVVVQALNHNVVDETIEVRHRIRIRYLRDRDLEAPVIPLHPLAAFTLKLVDGPDGYFGLSTQEVDPEKHGASCEVSVDAVKENGGHLNVDPFGRKFTGHWPLPPGREVSHTLVTKLLNLKYDTSIHYVAAHLHPFAESVELRDLTTGETVYRSQARQTELGVGLSDVDYFSSREGLPLYKDHQYQVISVYDNTSGVPQDAMATLFLYVRLHDLEEQMSGASPPGDAQPAASTDAHEQVGHGATDH